MQLNQGSLLSGPLQARVLNKLIFKLTLPVVHAAGPFAGRNETIYQQGNIIKSTIHSADSTFRLLSPEACTHDDNTCVHM